MFESNTVVENVLTIDVEDWFHILELPNSIAINDWIKQASYVEKNTLHILEILANYNVKATFFVLGWVAKYFPDLVKEIALQEHEVASHGFSHQLISYLTPEEFRRDVGDSLKYISRAIDNPVLGYRAPGFSITKETLWALDILWEMGLKYDASIFPINRNHGGYQNFCESAGWITTPKGKQIFEVPVTCNSLFNKKIYILGGGYFRLAPYWAIAKGIEQLNRRSQLATIYLHPRELDPDHPRLKMSQKRAFMSYVNLAQTESKLIKILDNFRWNRIDRIWEKDLLSEIEHQYFR